MAQTEAARDAASRGGSLAAALRATTGRAADLVRGVALLFACSPTETPGKAPIALRAAAGFKDTDEARAAARAVEGWARELASAADAVRSPTTRSFGPRVVSGGVGFPLCVGDRAWGALVVGGSAAIEEAALGALRAIAESAAVRLDHAHLQARVEALDRQLSERSQSEGDSSDEILKLSEALFAQDIELLRSNEQLGKVEKLKSDFIEKMSRELRTPLNSIIEAIIAVLAGENEQLSDVAKESLRAALDDGTTFQRTLQNILDLWRIKQGELPIQLQEVNFREVIEEAIFSVQDALDAKPVSIERTVQEPFPKVRTDLAKVNQILFLLLDNAVKFTPTGRIEIHAEVTGGRLRCSVNDTGIGICADDRQFIFDEFFQVEDPTSQRYRGAGLGLTLVRELLALLEGDIDVQSEVGQGTRMTFSLPVQTVGG